MTTSKHTQLNLESSMLSHLAFHARTSVQRAEAKALRKKPDQVYFTNSSESYAWYDPNTSSWKTWQRSLITDWELFSESFPKQGTMQNGQLYLQVHWEPVTSDQGGSVLQSIENLPTPRANSAMAANLNLPSIKNHQHPNLETVISQLPTPTAMDTKEDALKHATKLLQGKTHRSSGQPLQVSLSDAIMMEKIKENPELMKVYQDHQMEERPHLPKQEEFVSYLRSQTTIKELAEKTKIKKTTIEHWFRKDKAGFSYPSIKNWEEIKPHLKTIQFDMEMTTVQSKEWTTKNQMLPTPTAREYKGAQKEGYRERGYGPNLSDIFKQLPTPSANEHKYSMSKEDHQSGTCLAAMARKDRLSAPTGKPMSLNPAFVEEMMGYPIGHTDLKH